MRALVTVMPIAGHVAPVTGVVAELVQRGHQVTVYTGSRYHPRFTALGADVLGWSAAPSFDEEDLAAAGQGRWRVRRLMAKVQEVFVRSGTGQARDLLAEVDRTHPDVVVGDALSAGGGLVSELTGLPWASVSLLAFEHPSRELPPPGFTLAPARGHLGRARDQVLWAVYRLGTAPFRRAQNEVRAELGLPADRRPYGVSLFSPWLTLATGAPSLERPRGDLPEQVHFVGRLAPAGPTAYQPPPSRTGARPLVVVTQGTHNVEPSQLIQPALAGLADVAVDVVATTGRAGVADAGLQVPANATLVDFLDFDSALPDTAVLVSNGGWGGVLAGLAAGLPLVVAGADMDKPVNAARVARAGVGVDLRTGHPSPAAVAAAVRTVLKDARYRRRAQAVGAELAGLGGAGRAADLVEQLVDTKARVRRTADPWGRLDVGTTESATSPAARQ
jgi:UDP:flavonoid glycosyltransferase YjiC (YdhE family)